MADRKRRKLSKQERLAIYAKTQGHCAYCGIEITLQQMQADHVVPLGGWSVKGEDDLGNMLPACRSCNHYKGHSTLEGFRRNLANMPRALMRDSITYKNAVRYRLVKPTPHDVVFYFEQIGVMDNDGQ